jgi:hypothetical protein
MMALTQLDSRMSLGTDIESSGFWDNPDLKAFYVLYPKRQTIRVILAELGPVVRMSAPDLNLVVEGESQGEAWTMFLDEIGKRNDGAWLSFDVGPTRREEIAEGMDAPEDEDWSEPIEGDEG